MKKLRGTYTVIVTPFTADGARNRRVDTALARRLSDRRGDPRTDRAREQRRVSLPERRGEARGRTHRRRPGGGPRPPVVVGTAAESTDHVIRYTRDAEALGADAAHGAHPPTTAGSTKTRSGTTTRRVAESVSLPDHALQPPRLHRPRHQAAARRAARRDRQHLLHQGVDHRTPAACTGSTICGKGRITVFAGYLGYESFMVGAEGWVSVCANIAPRKSARLFELAVDENDREGAWRGLQGAGPAHRLPGRPPLRARDEGRVQDARPRHGRSAPAAPAASPGAHARASPRDDRNGPVRPGAAGDRQGRLSRAGRDSNAGRTTIKGGTPA